LTQNTTFTSVVKSLQNLEKLNCLSYRCIEKIPLETLKAAIRPSGYFNQKTTYILEFIAFFRELQGAIPSRQELLKIKGIGPETADSILLFAYNQPEFKVDAYTKRILLYLGYIKENATYHEIKKLMEDAIKDEIKDKKELVIIYQEFHALLVRHAKEFYSKKPYTDPILV
jgi:endonuclease III related protein